MCVLPTTLCFEFQLRSFAAQQGRSNYARAIYAKDMANDNNETFRDDETRRCEMKIFFEVLLCPKPKTTKKQTNKKKDPEAFRPIKVKIPRVFPVFLVDSLQNRLLFRGYCCPRPPRFGILFPKLSVRHDSLRLHPL